MMRKVLSIILAILICFGGVASADIIEGNFAINLTNTISVADGSWIATAQSRAFLTALLFLDLMLLEENENLDFWSLEDLLNDSYVMKDGSQVTIYVQSQNSYNYYLAYDEYFKEAIYSIERSYIRPDKEELEYRFSFSDEGPYTNDKEEIARILQSITGISN